MLRSLAHVGVAGPETDETLHLRLLRAVDRTDVEVQAVLGRLAFRYGHEDQRRDTWSPSHLLHQIGRFMLPRRLHFSILSISPLLHAFVPVALRAERLGDGDPCPGMSSLHLGAAQMLLDIDVRAALQGVDLVVEPLGQADRLVGAPHGHFPGELIPRHDVCSSTHRASCSSSPLPNPSSTPSASNEGRLASPPTSASHRRINRLTRRVVLFALLLARFLWDANDAREVAVPGGRTQRPVGSGRRTIHLATPSAHGPEGADLGTAG